MTFSILHTSARPQEYFKVMEAWLSWAANPDNVEYVLVTDPRWGFSQDPADYEDLPPNCTVQLNTGRRCYVDGVNIAAKASAGQVLIVNADDQYPCRDWDLELERLLPKDWRHHKAGDHEFVISVSTGTPDEHSRGIMVMPVLSRSRYERLGHVFYPGYESMWADNDFYEHARRDGIIIDGRHLMFPHKHWMTKDRALDDPDRAQNSQEAYQTGAALLERRRANGFEAVKHRRNIAICYAGEHFEGVWVDSLLTLYGHLVDLDFGVLRVRPQNWSNVFVSREAMRRAVLANDTRADLVLFLDDDNTLSPEKFDRLLQVLDTNPDVDIAAGWCWIWSANEQGVASAMPSVGNWSPDMLHWQPFPSPFANRGTPEPFETGGLPCVLLRREALEKAGDGCFLPVVDPRLEFGLSGEDTAFWKACAAAGLKMLVDPTVRVPHLKYASIDPTLPEQGKVPVKVACMIRAKNEARWIRRAIESVKPLCGENIFVMEDGSSDDTVVEAERAGAVLWHSPYAHLGLDEGRDKDWLLNRVIDACSPDWIIGLDGDEELEPGGCEKIRGVLETNPLVDVFGLGFLYFWDGLDQIRTDGVYGRLHRQTLFRPVAGLKFASYYGGDGENHNHVGLHVSNAPGVGSPSLRIQSLNVFLFHYGYVFRQDRIRKYQWITNLDPRNEQEDFYAHTVQGDGPIVTDSADPRVILRAAEGSWGLGNMARTIEIGRDEKLKHAGPLELRKLPARLVPHFEKEPEPFEVSVPR